MIRFIFLQIGFMIWTLWILGIGAHASIDREIILNANSETASQEICLQDLAQDSWLKSRCSVDHKNCCRWNLEGTTNKTFKIAELQKALDQKDLGGIHLILKSPDGGTLVQVSQTKRSLTENEIKPVLENLIQKKFADSVEINIESIKFASPIYTELNSKNNFKFELPEIINGKASIKILSENNEQLGWAQIVISKFIDVYVAKKTVHPTEKVTLENFELRKVDTSSLFVSSDDSFVNKTNFPEGVRAKFTIRAESPLTIKSIEKSPIVQLGDVVTIVLKSDNLRISTKGVVQGSGAVGDTVSVQLNRYNRTFKGKVQEGKTIEVSL